MALSEITSKPYFNEFLKTFFFVLILEQTNKQSQLQNVLKQEEVQLSSSS
jgi:hypothetical protein